MVASKVCTATEQIAGLHAVTPAQIALDCEARLLSDWVLVIGAKAKSYFQRSSRSRDDGELEKISRSDCASPNHSLREQRLVNLNRSWHAQRCRCCGRQ